MIMKMIINGKDENAERNFAKSEKLPNGVQACLLSYLLLEQLTDKPIFC